MILVFQHTHPSIHITLCHTEYKLATHDAMSHLAIPGTDYFSDVCDVPTTRVEYPSLANRPGWLARCELVPSGPHTERELSGASKGIFGPPNTVHPPQQLWTKLSSFPPRTTRSLVGLHRKWLLG